VTQDNLLWAAVVALAACALLGLAILLRDRAQLRRELAARQADVDHLAARVDGLTARVPRQVEEIEYVITDLGVASAAEVSTGSTGDGPALPARIDGKLFADIVLRETVAKTAALTHGVRRALAPEVVWRVRGEVRRELKRVRKQRKADLKVARREWEARRRAGLGDVA
jgi:hypothetical protein